MTTVYGSATVEPEGMELGNERYEEQCPDCDQMAVRSYWELAESGSINSYSALSCRHCGYFDGDEAGDEY